LAKGQRTEDKDNAKEETAIKGEHAKKKRLERREVSRGAGRKGWVELRKREEEDQQE
jgi:hypothetical protein